MNPLFRPEAVDNGYRRLEGRVLIATPLSTRLTSAVLVLIVVVAAGFLCLGTYVRKETVPGWIVPPGGLIRIIARQGGQVETLYVKEGVTIAKGEAVATVRVSGAMDGQDAGQAIMAGLRAQREASEQQTAATLGGLDSQEKSLGAQLETLRRDLEVVVERIQMSEDRQKVNDANLARFRRLRDQGYATINVLEAAELTSLTTAQTSGQLRSTKLAAERAIQQIEQQLAQIPPQRANARASSLQSAAELQQKLINAQQLTAYEIPAPIGGIVAAVPVEQGQTVPPGGTVAVLSPEGGDLLAEFYVPSRAAGFIKVGQPVKLMYQAFPYQKYGMGLGRITSISSTVLAPGEVAIPGLDLKEPVFRVRASIARKTILAYREELALRPGMMLSADILFDRRSLAEWILDPLYAGGKRL